MVNALEVPLELRLPKKLARTLAQANLHTVGDLLEHAPRRYYHWGKLTPMRLLHAGDDVTLLAQVTDTHLLHNHSKAGVRLQVDITDGTSTMTATFFAHNQFKLEPMMRILRPGEMFLFAGKIGNYHGRMQLVHPQFEGAEDTTAVQAARRPERPIPIYTQIQGLPSWKMTRAIGMVLDSLSDDEVPSVVPLQARKLMGIESRPWALRHLHQPETDDEYRLAQRSLAGEEAFVLETGLLLKRQGARAERAAASPIATLGAQLLASLPFQLTAAQQEAIDTISADLAQAVPMQRLLQGDVGSGKTVVALAAMAQVVEAGHQAAMLAPTAVLAAQHQESLKALLAGVADVFPVPVHLLTGGTNDAQRQELHYLMASGQPCIVVGTHALLQDTVTFSDLALVVVDEQHRFGVAQRDFLRKAGPSGLIPHQLVMTATPIPRTVALTVFGDLDTTIIKGLPAGRVPIKTFLIDAAKGAWVQRLWQRAREEVDAGGRVFIVCPKIDPGDQVADAISAESGTRPPLADVQTLAEHLKKSGSLVPVSIGQLTGRDSPATKDAVMRQVADGSLPVLVATIVIEVGIDVPDATMMIIMDAQQFGLSQLHQLRGRVGRSTRPSVCMAVHRTGLPENTMKRLEAFASTTDGFKLADEDLKLRREGDVVGSQQSGSSSRLTFLSVQRDQDLIVKARKAAQELLQVDPTLSQYHDLRVQIRQRSGTELVWLERS